MLAKTNLREGEGVLTCFAEGSRKPFTLILSTSLLDDRKLMYTGCLDLLNREASVKVWTTSAQNPRRRVKNKSVTVEQFPKTVRFADFPALPYNYLRRLNQFVWDNRQRIPSRVSRERHTWDKPNRPLDARVLNFVAKMLALLKAERLLEGYLEEMLLNYPCSPEAVERLKDNPPTVVVATGPNRPDEPPIIAAAKSLDIPTLAVIHSFDNLSTKGRMIVGYDGYLVWSEQMKHELHAYYPQSRKVPVYVVGAPQFDVFFRKKFYQTREAFCVSQGLQPELPIIVYALGSPNFLQEYHGALYMSEKVARGDLGNMQLLIRPHPQFDNGKLAGLLSGFGPRVVVQQTGDYDLSLQARFQDESQVMEWVNTFRHADVVVNLSSTVTVDAAIFDRPIVNLDYDPEPGQPNQNLVKDVNHLWTHFKPIAESGGVWLVNNPEEMIDAVRTYLAKPELHRERRRWIAEYVCGYLDGHCGERMAESILDFIHNVSKKGKLKVTNQLHD